MASLGSDAPTGVGPVPDAESLVGAIPVMVWRSGADRQRDYLNQHWLTWTGRTLEQELGTGWTEGVHPEDLTHCLEIYTRSFDERQPFEIEYRLRRAGGQYGWVLDRGVPLVEADGELIGFIGACTDISPLKAAEAQRRELHTRVTRLQAITSALSGAHTQQDVIDIVLSEALSALDAGAGAAALLDGDRLHVVGFAGYPHELIERFETFPVESPLPLSLAVRSGRTVTFANRRELLETSPELLGSLGEGHDSWMAAPIRVGERTLGSLGLSFTSEREFTQDEIDFVDAVAAQCAQAIDRSALYEQARAAGDRLAFLSEASRLLNESLDLNRTLRNLAELAVPRLADWCVIFLFDGQDNPRPLLAAHVDPARAEAVQELLLRHPVSMEAPMGIGRTLRTGESQMFANLDDDAIGQFARSAVHLQALKDIGFGSGMVVPLKVRGRVMGALSLANGRGRSASAADLTLAEDLAARGGAAIANAQLFGERSRVARSLQSSLLPPSLPAIPNVQLAARYTAAGSGSEVGGDFYDAFSVGSDNWLLVIGDVQGKGVAAAATTGLARHTIRAVAVEDGQPSSVLEHLNGVLMRAEIDPDDDDTGFSRFCTACVVAVCPVDGEIEVSVCSAGHPLPLVRRADGRVEEFGRTGDLVGVFDRPELHDISGRLHRGDALVCFTDGLTERRDGHRFLDDDLAQVLATAPADSAESIADALERAAKEFGTGVAHDDMALVVVRVPD